GKVVLVNETLASKLAVKPGDEIILRIRKPGALAQDAVITPRADSSIALRLEVGPIVRAENLGDFSLTANQLPVANAFLPLEFLGGKLNLPRRANLIVTGPYWSYSKSRWWSLAKWRWLRDWSVIRSRLLPIPQPVSSRDAIAW